MIFIIFEQQETVGMKKKLSGYFLLAIGLLVFLQSLRIYIIYRSTRAAEITDKMKAKGIRLTETDYLHINQKLHSINIKMPILMIISIIIIAIGYSLIRKVRKPIV
jgi:hypothetical protein